MPWAPQMLYFTLHILCNTQFRLCTICRTTCSYFIKVKIWQWQVWEKIGAACQLHVTPCQWHAAKVNEFSFHKTYSQDKRDHLLLLAQTRTLRNLVNWKTKLGSDSNMGHSDLIWQAQVLLFKVSRLIDCRLFTFEAANSHKHFSRPHIRHKIVIYCVHDRIYILNSFRKTCHQNTLI